MVSGLVLMCEKVQRVTFPDPGRGQKRGGGERGYWKRKMGAWDTQSNSSTFLQFLFVMTGVTGLMVLGPHSQSGG